MGESGVVAVVRADFRIVSIERFLVVLLAVFEGRKFPCDVNGFQYKLHRVFAKKKSLVHAPL